MGAVALSPKDIKSVTSPKSNKPSDLQMAARRADKIAKHVEKDWHKLPENVKHVLTCVAYSDGKRRIGFFSDLRLRLKRFRLFSIAALTGDIDSLSLWLSSLIRLHRAVLDAIEQENSSYQKDLVGIMRRLPLDPADGVVVDQDNIREKLKDLSSQALTELREDVQVTR